MESHVVAPAQSTLVDFRNKEILEGAPKMAKGTSPCLHLDSENKGVNLIGGASGPICIL